MMLTDTHKISVKFFNAAGADAIHIRFLGNDGKWHNVLIDGGYGHTYKDSFGPLIREILASGEYIDLWIVSHIDQDHIGAVLGFVKDRSIKDKAVAVRQFWFNHSPHTIPQGGRRVSVAQGINFRKYLAENNLLGKEWMTTELPPQELFGLKITLVSPAKDKLVIFDALWKKKERKAKAGRSAEKADHQKPFETLILADFSEDEDPWNGSSIACLLEFEDMRGLLLADSHPSVVVATLQKLGVSTNSPLGLDFVQMSHHGSKFNNSSELLGLIRTQTFIVTGNGVTNRHPDKTALVRVLTHPLRVEERISFVFPCDTPELRSLFDVDQDVLDLYDFQLSYPPSGQNFQVLNFIPIKKEEENEYTETGDHQNKM